MDNTYIDLDLSFNKNYYDDMGIIIDIDAIKLSIINNLMIPKSTDPFNNNYDNRSLEDWLHSLSDQESESDIKDFIESKILEDPRILKVSKITMESYDHEIIIDISLTIDMGNDYNTTIQLSIKKD